MRWCEGGGRAPPWIRHWVRKVVATVVRQNGRLKIASHLPSIRVHVVVFLVIVVVWCYSTAQMQGITNVFTRGSERILREADRTRRRRQTHLHEQGSKRISAGQRTRLHERYCTIRIRAYERASVLQWA